MWSPEGQVVSGRPLLTAAHYDVHHCRRAIETATLTNCSTATYDIILYYYYEYYKTVVYSYNSTW